MSQRLHVCGFCGSGEYNCPCRDREDLRRMIGVALIVLGLCGVLAVSAHGQESAAPAADGGYRHATAGQSPARVPAADGEGAIARTEPATLLAQACWLEATYRHDDCAAIVHVIKRRAARAGVSVAAMAVRYSALDSGTERAAQALRLPAGLDAAELPKWHALTSVVEGALSGRVKSPCGRADHWGARNLPRDRDRARKAIDEGRWRLLGCTTANAFYAETGRRAPERVLAAGVASGGGR
jgi:hypothetical protein